MRVISGFLRDESGATAIEYALIAAAMAVALVVALPGLRGALEGRFTELTSGLQPQQN